MEFIKQVIRKSKPAYIVSLSSYGLKIESASNGHNFYGLSVE